MDAERELDERGRRIGLNEAVFREFNERIEEVSDSFGLGDLELVCECGSVDCTERITMPVAEYEQLRSNPRHFAIVPGHEIPDVEDVVASKNGYDVVAKREGGPAALAEETDPRSRS